MSNVEALNIGELLELLHRVENAVEKVEELVKSHDDSPWRLVKFGGGVAVTAAGVLTLDVGSILSLFSSGGGLALAVNEAMGIAGSIMKMDSDDRLLQRLLAAQANIETAAIRLGAKLPARG